MTAIPLKPMGIVLKVTRSRNFLVRSTGPIRGDPKDLLVVDRDLRVVGVVRDVIGPVSRPYILVKVLLPLEEAGSLVGEKLYLPSRREISEIRARGSPKI